MLTRTPASARPGACRPVGAPTRAPARSARRPLRVAAFGPGGDLVDGVEAGTRVRVTAPVKVCGIGGEERGRIWVTQQTVFLRPGGGWPVLVFAASCRLSSSSESVLLKGGGAVLKAQRADAAIGQPDPTPPPVCFLTHLHPPHTFSSRSTTSPKPRNCPLKAWKAPWLKS